jgi:hypothetical protein
MRSINAFVRLAFLALPVFASEQLLPVKRGDGDVLKDSYIVFLDDGYNLSNVSDSIPQMNVTHEWTIVNGFAATLDDQSLDQLRALPGVSSISENPAAQMAARQ